MTFTTAYARKSVAAGQARKAPAWQGNAAPSVNMPAAFKVLSYRAPVGGLTLFNDLSDVPDGGALILDNYFPERDVVRPRGGAEERNTGLGATVRAIGVYEASNRKAFSFSGAATDDIHDITSPGAVGAALVTALANTTWSFAMFTTSGGPFLIAAGYGNAPLKYNGATWSTAPAITGVTATNLSYVWLHANRLFFVEKGTTNAWYLPVDSVGGVAVKFALGGEFPRGGTLVSGATWTTDAGNSGLKSTCVFISSEGDVAAYDGADPTTWSKIGTYEIAKPCGINCFMKTGGDLSIMTEDGLVAMSHVISLDSAALANESVSKNILPLWRDRVARTDTTLWQIARRDFAGMAIVSVPSTNVDPAYQFVANFQTGAWARWFGWDVQCVSVINNDIVYGTSDGRIMTGDTSGSDDGAPYTASWIGPFRMETANIMVAKLARAVVRSAETFEPQITVKADFDTTLPTPPQSGVSVGGDIWDTGIWYTAVWGRIDATRMPWQGVIGSGSALAPCIQYTLGQLESPRIEMVRVDLVYEGGEVVA